MLCGSRVIWHHNINLLNILNILYMVKQTSNLNLQCNPYGFQSSLRCVTLNNKKCLTFPLIFKHNSFFFFLIKPIHCCDSGWIRGQNINISDRDGETGRHYWNKHAEVKTHCSLMTPKLLLNFDLSQKTTLKDFFLCECAVMYRTCVCLCVL